MVQHLLRGLKTEFCLDVSFRPSMRRVEKRLSVTVMILDKLSHTKVEQVSTHLWRRLECDSLLVSSNVLRLDWHVGNDFEIGVGPDHESEDCFVCGVVQAGKDLPGIDRFEMSTEDILLSIGGPVESREVLRHF